MFCGVYECGDLDRCENRRVEEEREEAGGRDCVLALFLGMKNKRVGSGCVPVEERCESTDERVAEEEEHCPGKSGGQGEKFGEEEERGAREVVWRSASRRR
jgi:hypothetical protein